jgi:hypothetical protein
MNCKRRGQEKRTVTFVEIRCLVFMPKNSNRLDRPDVSAQLHRLL